MTVEIAYTEPRENHGTIILIGVSYSTYTLRYGPYCRYGIAPFSQSSPTFPGLLYDVCLGWYLRSLCFPFKVILSIQYALYMHLVTDATHFCLLSTCLLQTNSGCGKRETHINWSMVTCKMAAPVTGTTLRTTGPVPADSRQ